MKVLRHDHKIYRWAAESREDLAVTYLGGGKTYTTHTVRATTTDHEALRRALAEGYVPSTEA
jgi:hypothetical protein